MRVALSEEARQEPRRPSEGSPGVLQGEKKAPLQCRTVWLGSSEEELIMQRSQSDG